MAKYHITHACGCAVTHNLVGTNVNGERERKAEWLASRLCAECYRREQNEQAAAANKDLPALTGSEKQIAWAETIRAQAMTEIAARRERIAAALTQGAQKDVADRLTAILDAAAAQTEAKYWIDNRNYNVGSDLWLRREAGL